MSDQHESPWLSEAAVGELTGLLPTSYKAQCRKLARMNIKFVPSANGRPLVERALFLASGTTTATMRARAKPNWSAIRRAG